MIRRTPRHAAVTNSATTDTSPADSVGRLRVATYNIHKGVRGMGPGKRLEIHNLGMGVQALDADLVFLQEVRLFHHREARPRPIRDRAPPALPEQVPALDY